MENNIRFISVGTNAGDIFKANLIEIIKLICDLSMEKTIVKIEVEYEEKNLNFSLEDDKYISTTSIDETEMSFDVKKKEDYINLQMIK
jgi:hypothetical protein